jgi:hypothetical protein
MLKFHSFAVIGVAVVAMTLGTPGKSEAQIFQRWRAAHGRIFPQVVESQYSSVNPSGMPVVAPTASQPLSGGWQVIPAYTYGTSDGPRWGRYGNVIINRRKWGDLENRVSYGDLIRW